MIEWFESLVGPEYGQLAAWVTGIAVVILVLLIIWMIIRTIRRPRMATGRRSKQARLAVTDAAAIDSNRRLVLLRRDDVEHLIMIGGPTDIIIENDIRKNAPARAISQETRLAAPAPAPAPAQQAPAPEQSQTPPVEAKPVAATTAPVAPATPVTPAAPPRTSAPIQPAVSSTPTAPKVEAPAKKQEPALAMPAEARVDPATATQKPSGETLNAPVSSKIDSLLDEITPKK